MAEEHEGMTAITDVLTGADKPALRQQVLQEGITLTMGDRNKSYGDPIHNLGFIGKMKALFREELGNRKIGPAEMEAIDNIMQRLGRLATGATVHKDTYTDGMNYFAIAYECAMMEAGLAAIPPKPVFPHDYRGEKK